MTEYTITDVDYSDMDETAREKAEEAGVTEENIERITQRKCYDCHISEYEIRRTDTNTHTFVTDATRRDPSFACIYDDGLKDNYLVDAEGDEWMCEECLHDVFERGSLIVGIGPQENKVSSRHLNGVIIYDHINEWNTDGYDLEDFPALEGIEAIVANKETIPFTDDGLYATHTPKGEREITGDEMVDVFDRDAPYYVPMDYQTIEGFIEALRSGEAYIPSVVITYSGSVYVPEDDADMAFKVYRDWVDSDNRSSATA